MVHPVIERIRQWLYNRRRARELHTIAMDKAYRMSLGSAILRDAQRTAAGLCNICGHPYVGLAMDCKCTNWGR